MTPVPTKATVVSVGCIISLVPFGVSERWETRVLRVDTSVGDPEAQPLHVALARASRYRLGHGERAALHPESVSSRARCSAPCTPRRRNCGSVVSPDSQPMSSAISSCPVPALHAIDQTEQEDGAGPMGGYGGKPQLGLGRFLRCREPPGRHQRPVVQLVARPCRGDTHAGRRRLETRHRSRIAAYEHVLEGADHPSPLCRARERATGAQPGTRSRSALRLDPGRTSRPSRSARESPRRRSPGRSPRWPASAGPT